MCRILDINSNEIAFVVQSVTGLKILWEIYSEPLKPSEKNKGSSS